MLITTWNGGTNQLKAIQTVASTKEFQGHLCRGPLSGQSASLLQYVSRRPQSDGSCEAEA
eukprot:19697-Amphidinium_carterae.1